MAIGDNGGNTSFATSNYVGKVFENTYYSRLNFKNGESKKLSIMYKLGLMVLEISRGVGNGDTYKSEPEETIYLSPMKAHLLVNQINDMLEYRKSDEIDKNRAFGVNAGMNEKVTYIAFSVNEDKSIAVTIGKFDGNGVITESSTFNMSNDFNYALAWDDLSANSLSKVYDNDAEILMLRDAIDQFSRAMAGGYGYANLDMARYDYTRMNKRVDLIFDKLGIDRVSYGNNRSGGTNNFLNNTTSKSTSYEEIEDLLA